MPITIGSNIASLKAQRRLAEGSDTLAHVYERLSSGLRINRASDDAAGLAIASSLNSDSRVFTQAIRNVNDGLSLLSIAEGATKQLGNITTRMKELAEQSANGTFSNQQRSSLDNEFQALTAEYNRIIDTTEFNGRSLLSANFGTLQLQAGRGTDEILSFSLGAGLQRSTDSGTFSSAVTISNVGTDYNVISDDFNRDGISDLAITGQGSGLQIRLGNGDGTFKTSAGYATGNKAYLAKMSSGDVNGDGYDDLIVPETYANTVSVLINNGNGTFKARVSYTGINSEESFLADINNDGAVDLLIADPNTGYGVLLGNGNGTFQATLSYASNVRYGPTAYDLNGDGKLDLLGVTGSAELAVSLGNGNGTFAAATNYVFSGATSGPRALTLGDFNNDGKIDAIAGNFVTPSFTVLLGNGNGSFKASTSYQTDGSDNVVTIRSKDLNADGNLDVIFGAGSAPAVDVFFNNGNGTFKASVSYPVTGNRTRSFALADFTGDGLTDIVALDDLNSTINLFSGIPSSNKYLEQMNVASVTSALSALTTLDTALGRTAIELGNIGAIQSRLLTATATLQVRRENYQAAEARISNADIAEESAAMTRTQILQQAAAAVLGQANQQPAIALSLLR